MCGFLFSQDDVLLLHIPTLDFSSFKYVFIIFIIYKKNYCYNLFLVISYEKVNDKYN